MNSFQNFTISLGNSQGKSSLVLLQERTNKIEIVNLRATKVENPKIQIRKFNQISLGPLQQCIRKKKDKQVLSDLLRIQLNCDIAKIAENCETLQNKVNNDIALLGALMEEKNSKKFTQKTKASRKQGQKYLAKYKNLDEAISQYQKHQLIIKKFMQNNNCDRENAIMFLESNNYELF